MRRTDIKTQVKIAYLLLLAIAFSSAQSGFADDLKSAAPEVLECNPVVTVEVEEKLRFEVLKGLAEKHGFSVKILEGENSRISLAKRDELSRVIESITKGMNVVLNYQKKEDCERLIAISILEDGSNRGNASGGIREYNPTVGRVDYPIQVVESPEADETFEQTQKRLQAAYKVRNIREKNRQKKNLELLNETLPDGDELKNVYVAKPGWDVKTPEKISIEDMDSYVDEVLNGQRVPELDKMTIKQRIDYNNAHREKRLLAEELNAD